MVCGGDTEVAGLWVIGSFDSLHTWVSGEVGHSTFRDFRSLIFFLFFFLDSLVQVLELYLSVANSGC